MSELPQADSADTDTVQMALQAAHTLWSRGDTTESLRWLKRAAESASDEGADLRSLQLAKAAAELRAKLFPSASDAPPAMSSQAMPARVPTQRDLSGVRRVPSPEQQGEEEDASSPGTPLGEPKPGARPEDSSPGMARSPSSVPQYVVHRPREQQRQLMGLSSSTMETARQHNGLAGGYSAGGYSASGYSAGGYSDSGHAASGQPDGNGPASSHSASSGPAGYASVPSWSAGSERRTSAPPPLPHSLDDYEELEAEPIHDSDTQASAASTAWAATAAPTWRPAERPWEGAEVARREAGSDSSPRVATLPPPSFQPSALSSSPPPLPELSAFADEDGDPMRPEQQTVALPPRDEQGEGPDPSFFTAPAGLGAHDPGDPGAEAASAGSEQRWDVGARSPADAGSYSSWATEASRPGAWPPGGAEPASSGSFEPSPPAKLRARVHHQAVRVALAPDPRVPGQYVVRPLREGERAPAGERVALLVGLEPGVPLV